MTSESFVLDSNALITPYRSFYPFDLMSFFWDFISKNISSNKIVILDMVYDEIIREDDLLEKWLSSIDNSKIITHKNEQIICF